MHEPLDGGCLCGATRYRVRGPALSVSVCHCATCRRAAGAQSVAWGVFPAAAFAFMGTDPARFASSPGITRTHCAACGTSLTFQRDPASIDVTLASLDRPEDLVPTEECWLSHRLSWEAIDPTRKAHSRGDA